jgi:hypothetical protein
MEEDTVPLQYTRMVYSVNRAAARVLDKLARAPRLSGLGPEFSRGWDESIDRKKGFFEVRWGQAATWSEAILQGPHLFVANPSYKSPNETMLHQQDWSPIDLEALAPDALPVTSYKPAVEPAQYDSAYTHWGPERSPARNQYRVAWRNMAANTGERTLIPAIIPPGAAHVDGIYSLGFARPDARMCLVVAGQLGSLLNDFAVRVAPKSTIRSGTATRLPVLVAHPLLGELEVRALRLNALTASYSALWDDAYTREMQLATWTGGLEYPGRSELGAIDQTWTPESALRRASDRRQALVETDAIFAVMLGLSADELCAIYRTQFAVLYGYDRNTYYYDANGRLVPNDVLKVWRTKGERITAEERTATNASGNTYMYELPFVTLDREADMRQAYAHFERILQENA